MFHILVKVMIKFPKVKSRMPKYGLSDLKMWSTSQNARKSISILELDMEILELFCIDYFNFLTDIPFVADPLIDCTTTSFNVLLMSLETPYA